MTNTITEEKKPPCGLQLLDQEHSHYKADIANEVVRGGFYFDAQQVAASWGICPFTGEQQPKPSVLF